MAKVVDKQRVSKPGGGSSITIGTTTLTGGTTGSVLFVGASSVIQQDNTNFFWDDTDNRLGLGLATPSSRLHIKAVAAGTANILRIQNSAATQNLLVVNEDGSLMSRLTSGVQSLEIEASGYMTMGNIVASSNYGLRVEKNGTVGTIGINRTTNGGAGLEVLCSGTGGVTGISTVNSNSTGFNTGAYLACDGAGDANWALRVSATAASSNLAIRVDAGDISFESASGCKIGTATSQKIGLWNTAPDIQPTNAIVAAAFVANSSGIADDTATWGGYTGGQIVAALKRLGALA